MGTEEGGGGREGRGGPRANANGTVLSHPEVERDPREHSGLASSLQVQGKQMGKPQNTTLVHLEKMPDC